MAEIKFAFDWLDADGVQGLELHATWAQFALSVDGDVVLGGGWIESAR